MMFTILEETIYYKSRYELVMLLQDMQQGQSQTAINFNAHATLANHCEHLMENNVSKIPFSEERLALFLHTYFNDAFIAQEVKRAFLLQHRSHIWFALRYPMNSTNAALSQTDACHFYISDIFGLFSRQPLTDYEEMEFVLSNIHNLYVKNKKEMQGLDKQLFSRELQTALKKYPNNAIHLLDAFATISFQQSHQNNHFTALGMDRE